MGVEVDIRGYIETQERERERERELFGQPCSCRAAWLEAGWRHHLRIYSFWPTVQPGLLENAVGAPQVFGE